MFMFIFMFGLGSCRRRLREVAESNGERLLESTGNTISFAITLDTLVREVRCLRFSNVMRRC